MSYPQNQIYLGSCSQHNIPAAEEEEEEEEADDNDDSEVQCCKPISCCIPADQRESIGRASKQNSRISQDQDILMKVFDGPDGAMAVLVA